MPVMLTSLSVLFAAGALAGLLAGLLGVGGGIIMVPVLIVVLPGLAVGPDVVAQVAVGTSLACICVVSIVSARSHHRRGGVLWRLFLRLAPGLVVGGLLGAWVAHFLPSMTLQRIVGVAAVLLSIKIATGVAPPTHRSVPGAAGLGVAGTAIGSLSSLVGIGGGSLTVPFLNWCNIDMKRAVGTSAACGIAIAWAGVFGFLLTGWGRADTGVASLGYVSLPAFVALTVASISCVPLGTALAYRLPAGALKRVFALLLAVVGVKMLLG